MGNVSRMLVRISFLSVSLITLTRCKSQDLTMVVGFLIQSRMTLVKMLYFLHRRIGAFSAASRILGASAVSKVVFGGSH